MQTQNGTGKLTNMATSPEDKMEGKSLEQLKWARRGKKAAITKRIETLERLVSEGGSRRTITSLLEMLQEFTVKHNRYVNRFLTSLKKWTTTIVWKQSG